MVLAFGLPVFMLPDKIELDDKKEYSHTDSLFVEKYNAFVKEDVWKEKIKPVIDKSLGGTLRLFVEKVFTLA